MTPRTLGTMALFAMAAMAAGCANDGSALSTASVAPDKVAQAPKVDPACATLASQIDGLRKDGAVERLEQAATGKGKSVQVQRTSLAKQAELNKANADFQAKCGPKLPQTAQAAPAAAQVAPVAAAAASATQVKAATAVAPAAAQVAPKN